MNAGELFCSLNVCELQNKLNSSQRHTLYGIILILVVILDTPVELVLPLAAFMKDLDHLHPVFQCHVLVFLDISSHFEGLDPNDSELQIIFRL